MSNGKVSRLLAKDNPTLPTTVGVLARLAARRAMESGVEALAPIIKRAGLPSTLVIDPRLRLDARSQILFLNMIAEAIADPLLGFHMARDADLREIDPFFYVLSSSEKLGEAFEHVARYSTVINEGVRFIAARNASSLSVEFGYVGIERYIDRQQIEFWATWTVKAARLLLNRELVPSHVGFVHHSIGDSSEMERYFGCAVEFGASADRVHFEPQEADMPVVTADPSLNRFMVAYYEDAAAQRHWRQNPLRTRVENAISPRLQHATVNIGTIASDLGLSTRTLSRRLADEGLTFSSILDELRRALSDRYLQNKDLSISQIAWLLGYTEVSSFVHAFQRWTGQSPRDARRALRPVAQSDEN
ncbi:AraC family transcriptional regulator [Microvirga antarctica]|uniref:AraC family transcriptional regulator n=1 Tax=Microvirga antarctica TaxID=2819233 RepID=UPI001B309288|nr:AraC family transcriptional regulator [Microvirga antarctica]